MPSLDRGSNLHSIAPQVFTAAILILGLAISFVVPGVGASAGVALAVAAALFSPPIGLLAALAMLPLHTHMLPMGPVAVSATELMVVAVALGSVLRWLLVGGPVGRENGLGPTGFDLPIILFLSSALLSLTVTEYFRLSLRELRTLILEPVVTYYLLIAWFPGRGLLWPLGAFLTGAVAVALAGIGGMALGWGISEAEGVQRLQSTYSSPNHLGLFLGRALPWLLALSWLGGVWRAATLCGTTIVAAALVGTFSLGAWIGSVGAVLALAWATGGTRKLALAAGLAASVAVAALAFIRVERVWSHLEPGRGTTFFRIQVWRSGLAMIRDHPVLGIGMDNFLYLYQQRYILPSALAEANLSHPHNLVLHFWLQLGLLGLAVILWLLASALALASRLFYTGTNRLTRALALGALGSLVDFVIHGLIDNSYFLPDLAVVFWLTLAVLSQCRRGLQSPSVRASSSWP